MNPRRLDIEAYRDCLLQATGSLDTSLGGPSVGPRPAGEQTPHGLRPRQPRRHQQACCNSMAFPEATMHSPGRETTTTPLQQLFVMNSPFMRDRPPRWPPASHKESDAERQGPGHVP